MALETSLRPELVLVLERAASRDTLFEEIARRAASMLEAMDEAAIVEGLVAREAQNATCTPEGVAFPHVVDSRIQRTLIGAALLRTGVSFGHPKYPPSDLVFFLFGNSEVPWEHVRVLARLARIVRSDEARQRLRSARDAEELHRFLLEEDRSHD